MFFNDDVRVGDTSTATTFQLGGELNPNASQYGWTKEDQAHYNQLIGYVSACKQYYEDTSVIGGYVKEALSELSRIESMILYINTESTKVETLAAQIEEDTAQAGVYNNSTSTMYKAIQLLVNEVRTKYDEIVLIGQQADQDAEDAKADATLAGDYYLRTKAMYDEWKATQP